jgi:hypothetical protein
VITLPRTVRVWAYGRPTDLRKSYNGLVGIVEGEFRSDVMGGDLYLFVNIRRTGVVGRHPGRPGRTGSNPIGLEEADDPREEPNPGCSSASRCHPAGGPHACSTC